MKTSCCLVYGTVLLAFTSLPSHGRKTFWNRGQLAHLPFSQALAQPGMQEGSPPQLLEPKTRASEKGAVREPNTEDKRVILFQRLPWMPHAEWQDLMGDEAMWVQLNRMQSRSLPWWGLYLVRRGRDRQQNKYIRISGRKHWLWVNAVLRTREGRVISTPFP